MVNCYKGLTKMMKLEYFVAMGFMAILLYEINQGFSQTNDTQFTTYENKELGISFQYPSNWLEMNEEFRKQIPEFMRQALNGQNLTSNEKVYAEAVPVVYFILPATNNPLGVTLVNYKFPSSISVDEFNQIGLKFLKASGYNANILENTNTTISNNLANKGVIKIDEGPARGISTSITFFNEDDVISLQLGPSNNVAQSSVINKIIESIKINN